MRALTRLNACRSSYFLQFYFYLVHGQSLSLTRIKGYPDNQHLPIDRWRNWQEIREDGGKWGGK